MNIKYLIAAWCLAVGFQASSQHKLKKTKISDNITMELPEDFRAATAAEILQKNISSKPPIALYTDYHQQVDVVINETSNTWQGNDLKIIQGLYKSNIANLFTEVQFLKEEIVQVGGRDFIVFEFISRVTDANETFGDGLAVAKYTYIQYTLHKNKILLFNFSSPARDQQKWQPLTHEIMNSVRVK